VQVRVLGPLELSAGGGQLALGAPKQKAVLALLLARAGTVVPVDDLVDELWQDRPPRSALANVRMYAANLRRLLAPAPGAPVLDKRGPGYVLTVEPAGFDLARFRELVRQGREALGRDDFAAAVDRLDEGLGLWRGRVVADVPAGRLLTGWRVALDAERLAALEDRGQALLGLDAPERAAAAARELLQAEPLRERAHALLIRARYRAGDVAGALAAYDAARRSLVDQLGVEPGEELRRLQLAVLNREPALSPSGPPVPAGGAAGPGAVVPRQLPTDVAAFTGRAVHLRQLDGLLPAVDGDRPAAVVISSIAGTAGVGKTALAVHWAHRVRDRFPDGQLYVNLRGFDPGEAAMHPAEAVRGFLDALAVPPERIPAGLQAQAALYRSLLAGKRVLVVLDNARDADQVRPLLPGSGGCLVVVTSRNQLPGLVATEGAHPLSLDLLSAAEARQLLVRRLGADRVRAEPRAVDEIVSRCARLPLALTIVAARAATHPRFGLATLVAELREAQGGLDAFAGEDAATDVRAVFSWSYRMLNPDAARLFRLLGLYPGPDIGLPAAASLAGVPVRRARPLLTELARAHLVTERAPGRYAFHDLLRAYATELAHGHDAAGPEADPRGALHRVLDHYLHTAHAAALLLYPHRHPITLPAARDDVTPEELTGHDQALGWFTAEHPDLLAAIDLAASEGFDAHTWRLAWTLWDFFDRRGHWHDLAATQDAALAAATRLADPAGLAHTRSGLGLAHARLGHYDDAHAHYLRALDLFGELGDRAGQANTHLSLCTVFEPRGRYREALVHAQHALDLYRTTGNQVGQANAMNNLGWLHAQLEDHQQALAYCKQALALQQGLADLDGEAAAWDSLAYAHHLLGDHRQAVACCLRSLELYRELGDRYIETEVLVRLGETHRAAGNPGAAREVWQQALRILEELGHPDADDVRTRLDQLDRAVVGP
jgi:DNA-binding SARP family transcriptional activator